LQQDSRKQQTGPERVIGDKGKKPNEKLQHACSFAMCSMPHCSQVTELTDGYVRACCLAPQAATMAHASMTRFTAFICSRTTVSTLLSNAGPAVCVTAVLSGHLPVPQCRIMRLMKVHSQLLWSVEARKIHHVQRQVRHGCEELISELDGQRKTSSKRDAETIEYCQDSISMLRLRRPYI
jgi:hypothetical protein